VLLSADAIATKLFVRVPEPIDYLCVVVFSLPLIILSKKEAAMTDNTTAQSSHYEDETSGSRQRCLGSLCTNTLPQIQRHIFICADPTFQCSKEASLESWDYEKAPETVKA